METNNKVTKESKIYLFENVKHFIDMADKKVGAGLTFLPIITGIVSFYPIKALSEFNWADGNVITFWFAFAVMVLTGLLFIAAILCYCMVLCPDMFGKTKLTKKKGKKLVDIETLSTTFFYDISSFGSAQKYIDTVISNGEDALENDILRNTFDNSEICKRKMRTYMVGIWLTFATIVMSVIALLVCLFI